MVMSSTLHTWSEVPIFLNYLLIGKSKIPDIVLAPKSRVVTTTYSDLKICRYLLE